MTKHSPTEIDTFALLVADVYEAAGVLRRQGERTAATRSPEAGSMASPQRDFRRHWTASMAPRIGDVVRQFDPSPTNSPMRAWSHSARTPATNGPRSCGSPPVAVPSLTQSPSGPAANTEHY